MAEDVKLVLRYRVEANAPLAYQKPILLMEGDKRANVLQISLFDGEKAVDLTGLSVGGSVLRADGADVAIEGEIDGNVINCVLSEYAYAVAGPFKAFVQLLDSMGDVKRTVLLLAGMVESRGHGPQIDTGKELPSLDDILAQLETMRNVTQAANTAAGDANTAAAAANSAASEATGAANSATTAAGTANAAADRANGAAQNWEEGTVKNAERLGGVPADSYALKTDTAPNAESLGGVPAASYALKTDTAPNADKLGNKPPEYYLTPVNLLDNSNLLDTVNQRGYESDTAVENAHFIDRWSVSGASSFSLGTNGMEIKSGFCHQIVSISKIKSGHAYTLACKMNGNILCYNGVAEEQIGAWEEGLVTIYYAGQGMTVYLTKAGATYEWVALYEGAYTAETLPPYVPKPYAVELAECQRYYQEIPIDVSGSHFTTVSDYPTRIPIIFPTQMRKIPDAKLVESWNSAVQSAFVTYVTASGLAFAVTATADGNFAEWHGKITCNADL